MYIYIHNFTFIFFFQISKLEFKQTISKEKRTCLQNSQKEERAEYSINESLSSFVEAEQRAGLR